MAISIENVSHAYGATAALEDVSLANESGRFTTLLGPNGAGKSTLVALLTGLFVTGRAPSARGGPGESYLEILSC